MNSHQMTAINRRLSALPQDRQTEVLFLTLGGIAYWIERNRQTRLHVAYRVLEENVAKVESALLRTPPRSL